MENEDHNTTHFGYEKVSFAEKTRKVSGVFHSVAGKYDLMNDLMSFGVHRLWKRIAINLGGIRPDQIILDLAGGTGDLTMRIAQLLGEEGKIYLSDINSSMLEIGRQNLLDRGIYKNIEYIIANAEELPFADNSFDRIIIGFGLRNVTNKEKALHSMYRVLKPGGRAIILEFSKPTLPGLQPIYDAYSFSILPLLGKMIAKDEQSYRYLSESIRVHPNQETLKNMVIHAGFDECDYHNLSAGIVAIHRGFKY